MVDAAPAPRRGRRPAGQDARGEILTAARAEFLERGYEATSLRSVARRAGVDPGTVRHWFPGKARLLTATLGVTGIEPDAVVERVVAGPRETLGERLVEGVIGLWDADDGDTVRLVVPAVLADAELRGLLLQFIGSAVLGPVMRAVEAPDAPLRAALVASQMSGVLLTRYLLRVDPLAGLAPREVGRLVGPTLQRYLTEPLAWTARPGK